MHNNMRDHFKNLLIFLFVLSTLTTFGQTNVLRNSIYFSTGKHELSIDCKNLLDNMIDSLSNYQSYQVFIQGNTDNIGDSISNKNQSENRILATRQYSPPARGCASCVLFGTVLGSKTK